MRKFKVEVCVDSVESAFAAVEGGADRLEICGNLALGGGTTPSVGLVRLIKQACPENIELMAMIRPRTGDFLYTSDEISVMLEDIKAFAEIGITGVVFGALTSDGRIDIERTTLLTNEAVKYGLQVCFHRAFDMVVDQKEALSELCKISGITRLLTSGGKPSASLGLPSLVSLCMSLDPESGASQASRNQSSQIEMMPGSGINSGTITPVLRALMPFRYVRSIHMSGGGFVESTMQYRPEGMGMGVGGAGEWGVWRTSKDAVRRVRKIVDDELE
ncbi:hypothetical protein ACEPAH_1140 [Sanghuangporus vaninii]